MKKEGDDDEEHFDLMTKNIFFTQYNPSIKLKHKQQNIKNNE